MPDEPLLVSRRSLLMSISAGALLTAVGTCTPLGLSRAFAGPTGAAGKVTFNAKVAPIARDLVPLAGVRHGRPATSSVRRVSEATGVDTLQVAVDSPTKQNYWYFADGVVLTARGLQPWERGVVQDVGPDGRVVTFDAVHADARGVVSTKLRFPDLSPALGTHLLRVTAASGQTGSVPLLVIPWSKPKYEMQVTPDRLTERAWLDSPVTITVTGLPPEEPVGLHFIQPDGVGYQIGATERLHADAKGKFIYQVQSTSVLVPPGLWEVSLTTGNDGYAYDTFTLLQPRPPKTIGKLTAAKHITQEAFKNHGLKYAMQRMAPFELVLLTLRTPRGIDNIIGFFRLNGDGDHVNSISSSDLAPTGTYTLLVQSLYTGRWNSRNFTVTDARGTVPDPIGFTLADAHLTRLEAMDPDRGIVAHARGFKPGDLVQLLIKDANSKTLPLTPESIDSGTAGKNGHVELAVSARVVPATGPYTVHVRAYAGGDPVDLRQPLTITR